MKQLLGLSLFLMATSTYAFGFVLEVPEIDPSSGVAALALISGGMAVLRGRRKK